MGRIFSLVAMGLAVVLLSASACGAMTPTQEEDALSGGIVATFDVVDEQFKVWVTNPQTIEQILSLQRADSTANIPNGAILRGPGEAEHNEPWSWHLDPERIEMVEIAIEVCDGSPSFVEAELDYFVETVGRYCPWSAQLVVVEDYR